MVYCCEGEQEVEEVVKWCGCLWCSPFLPQLHILGFTVYAVLRGVIISTEEGRPPIVSPGQLDYCMREVAAVCAWCGVM